MVTPRPLRVLFSARDAGAAKHIREFASAAMADERFDATAVAVPPALHLMHEVGLPATAGYAGTVGRADDEGALSLMRTAEALLDQVRPDAVVVGVSGPELGLDEALTACAGSAVCYAMQDYPGWVVEGFGSPAPTYFVVDEVAAELTRRRYDVRTVVVGSAPHAAWGTVDTAELRSRGRSALSAGGPILGFYGQPAWFLPGYERTLERFAAASAATVPQATLLYRPHPKETEAQRLHCLSLLGAAGMRVTIDPIPELNASLCAVDMVCTCYSSCARDLMYLQRLSSAPLGAAVFLMVEPDLRRHHVGDTGVECPDYAEQGMALMAGRPDEVETVLAAALQPAIRDRLWRTVRTKLPDPSGATAAVLETMWRDLENGRQEARTA